MLIEPFRTNFLTKLESYESRVAWMYLDTCGNVTCGIGHMIATMEDALSLPWSGADAAADWHAVKSARSSQLAHAYQSLTTCRLSDAAIETIRDRDLDTVGSQIKAFLPAFDDLPQAVQQAILDMAFNLGPDRLRREYFGPACHFGPAIERGDWTTAAAECNRRGISAQRNQETADLILSAMPPAAVS